MGKQQSTPRPSPSGFPRSGGLGARPARPGKGAWSWIALMTGDNECTGKAIACQMGMFRGKIVVE